MHSHIEHTGLKDSNLHSSVSPVRTIGRISFIDRVKSPWVIRALVVSADMVAVVTAFLCLFIIRISGLFSDLQGAGFPLWLMASTTVLVLLYWLCLFWFCGVYIAIHNRSLFDEYYGVLKVILAGCGIGLLALLIDSSPTPSGNTSNRFITLLMYFFLMASGIGLGRYLVRVVLRKLRKRGIGLRRTIIIGESTRSLQLLEMFETQPELGYHVIGTVGTRGPVAGAFKQKFLGDVSGIDKIIASQHIEVTVLGMEHERDTMLKLVTETAVSGTTIKIIPDLYEIVSGQARAQHLYGLPLIEINPNFMSPWQQNVKRLMDIVVSFLVLTLGMPLWLIIALLVKLEDRGPIIYSQQRCGMNSKLFLCYKFRSMRTDAEKKGISWTTVNDPRVTRIGRLLRQSHIDEVPQFWNILRGDMSLVGPRPERPHYVEKFSAELPAYPRRLRVKPGLTGWHQVMSDEIVETVEFVQERLRHDFFYIENMSLRLDIEIILRTVIRMLQRKGQA